MRFWSSTGKGALAVTSVIHSLGGVEIHWYCACGGTRQAMAPDVAEKISPSFICQFCGTKVGPVYESEEVIRHEVEQDGG